MALTIDIGSSLPSPKAREKASARMQKRAAGEADGVYVAPLKKLCMKTECELAASDHAGRILSTGARKNIDEAELSISKRTPMKKFETPFVPRSPKILTPATEELKVPIDRYSLPSRQHKVEVTAAIDDPLERHKLRKKPAPQTDSESIIDPFSKYPIPARRSTRSATTAHSLQETAKKEERSTSSSSHGGDSTEAKGGQAGSISGLKFFDLGPLYKKSRLKRTYGTSLRTHLEKPFKVPTMVTQPKRTLNDMENSPRRGGRFRDNSRLDAVATPPNSSSIDGFINPFDKLEAIKPDEGEIQISAELSEYLTSKPDMMSSVLKKCPCCDEEVDAKSMQDFFKGKRPNGSSITRFCKQHRTLSAQTLWNELGYPDIDWKKLDGRLKKHYGHLEAVLRDKKSVFRDRQVELIMSGNNISLFRQLGTEDFDRLTPGYYGGRGADMMLDAIIRDLNKAILAASETDDVVNNCSGGMAGYIQTVLVPELAMRLVMEDMKTDEEGALEILVKSVALGDLLCS